MAVPWDMSWFRVSGGRLHYRGRITRAPFTEWTATKEGAASVARVAAGIRFSLFGRSRAARTRLWRELEAASGVHSLAAAIDSEALHYMQTMASLAYADGLPRVHIALHRLVLVPQAMIAGHVRAGLFKRLNDSPPLAPLDEALRLFFLEQLVIEMNAAMIEAAPTPGRPVQAHDEWACIGAAPGLVWVDSLWSGPDGTGHVFMYEFPRPGMPQPSSRELKTAVTEMASNVSSLTRLQRSAMVRAAVAR